MKTFLFVSIIKNHVYINNSQHIYYPIYCYPIYYPKL